MFEEPARKEVHRISPGPQIHEMVPLLPAPVLLNLLGLRRLKNNLFKGNDFSPLSIGPAGFKQCFSFPRVGRK